jgi:hypothetical protein
MIQINKLASSFLTLSLCFSFVGADTDGCDSNTPAPVSASGVSKASVQVPRGSDGLTTEQRNIAERLKKDNEPGAIKHLYVISAFSGKVLIYSTVRGKVTSGGKRLTPTKVETYSYQGGGNGGFAVPIGNSTQTTTEVLQDDGTYGTSGDYLFWFDSRGIYHQQYATDCIIHISDQPLPVKDIVLNMELSVDQQADSKPVAPIVTGKK